MAIPPHRVLVAHGLHSEVEIDAVVGLHVAAFQRLSRVDASGVDFHCGEHATRGHVVWPVCVDPDVPPVLAVLPAAVAALLGGGAHVAGLPEILVGTSHAYSLRWWMAIILTNCYGGNSACT